jgi:hypothetical protein
MKSLPYWFIGLATLFAIAGMGFGIYMSAIQDHTLSGAHAHNNLIGWVTMALYGLYYKAVPVALTRLALVHFWVALAGALTFGPGVAMAILGRGEILVQISSVLVVLAMLIFAYKVWTNRAGLSSN